MIDKIFCFLGYHRYNQFEVLKGTVEDMWVHRCTNCGVIHYVFMGYQIGKKRR